MNEREVTLQYPTQYLGPPRTSRETRGDDATPQPPPAALLLALRHALVATRPLPSPPPPSSDAAAAAAVDARARARRVARARPPPRAVERPGGRAPRRRRRAVRAGEHGVALRPRRVRRARVVRPTAAGGAISTKGVALLRARVLPRERRRRRGATRRDESAFFPRARYEHVLPRASIVDPRGLLSRARLDARECHPPIARPRD